MNKTKLFVWLLILGFFALLFYQNRPFLMDAKSLRLNLGVLPLQQTPELPVGVFFVIFFVVGMLAAYFFGMPERMRTRKNVKRLSANSESQDKEIAELKLVLANLKGISSNRGRDEQGDSSITSPVPKS
jgi:uncharacterized integral membrane protein